MNSKEPNKESAGEGKTQAFYDRTIDSDIHSPDLDVTIAGSETGASSGSGITNYSERVGDTIGPYHLVEELGSGGMGTVYRAEQSVPVKREVALKIIKAGMDTDQVIIRFEAERQALSMMEHANIARVLDANATDKGRPYFVMELVRGKAVTKFCDEHKLSIRARLKLFCEICHAIQHAHQTGIIHRDLKPSNILVSMQDGAPVPKVIDFGVAKATKQRLTERTMHTQQGQVVGTLEYMSPEQAQMTDANVDTRTDIYSLGVILYELLTGNTPLNRESISNLGYLDILGRIKDQEAQKPSSRLTESVDKLDAIAKSRNVEPRKLSSMLRGDLDWIVLMALDKEPARRYETAASFADDIERYLRAEPIDARPPTNLYLWGKFAKRHKVAVTAGVITLVTLISGVVLSTSQWIRAKEAEATVAEQMVGLQRSIELEKENETLLRQQQKKDENAKSNLTTEIQLLSQFGRWRGALRELDSYETQFGAPPIEIELLRLEALDALSHTAQLRQAIVRLESHPQAETHSAQLQLWRGYVFLSASDGQTDSRTLIKQAIESGQLDASDQFFAEGLLQESFSDAIESYSQALELSPFHSQARTQLIVTLILLGRYDEVQRQIEMAQTMFPNDFRYEYAEFVSHSLAAKFDNANAVRPRVLKHDSVRRSDLRSLNRLTAAVNAQFRRYDQDGLLDWFSIVRRGFSLFQEESYRQIPVPQFQKERVFSAYGEFAASFLNPLMRIAKEKKKHQLIITNCQTAWGIHKDGLFKCFEGWSWFALEEYEKAAAAFDIALKSDGLFPDIRNQGIYGAFISRKSQFDATQQEPVLTESMMYLEQYMQNRFETHRATTMFTSAAEAGRWDLARQISEEMIAREGGLEFNWSMILMNEAEQRGNLGLALEVCDGMLAKVSENPTLSKRRQQLVDKISASGAKAAGDQ